MRRLYILLMILLVLAVASAGCSSSRKSNTVLRSLMIQENTTLGRNKAYYSKHNRKAKRIAYRKYKKNRRY